MANAAEIQRRKAEIIKILGDSLAKLRTLITANMSQILVIKVNNEILNPMTNLLNTKILELSSLIPVTTAPTTQPSAADDAKDKHLGPRGKKQNKKLPDFWRKNFDYLESPYMHLDEIKTITDRPKLSKRRK